MKLIALETCDAFLGIDGYARIISHLFVCSRCEVEERCLSAVGVSHQCHVYHAPLVACRLLHLFFTIALVGCRRLRLVVPFGVCDQCVFGVFRFVVGHVDKLGLFFRNHFNHLRLVAAERNFVTKYLVFHGVLKGRIEQHLHGFTLDKAHLYDAFSKTTVAQNFHHNGLFSRS